VGIVINETADASAKESISKGGDTQYLIPIIDLKSYWKTKQSETDLTAEEWHRESGKQKGRKYFENY
jgi:hypothetical protein